METKSALRLTKILTIVTTLGFLLYLYQLFGGLEPGSWQNQSKLTGIYQAAAARKHAAIMAGSENAAGASLSEPLVSHDDLLNWLKTLFKDNLRFSSNNTQQQLDQMAPYFSENGWVSFLRAVMDSRSLDMVIQTKTEFQIIAIGDLKILKRENKNGVYTWVVSAPTKVTFSREHIADLVGMTRIQIVRVPQNQNKLGVGVDQFLIDTSGRTDILQDP